VRRLGGGYHLRQSLTAGVGSAHPTDVVLILPGRNADRATMQTYVDVLKQLVRESRYTVDERAVAEAILMRARIHLTADHAEVQKHLAWLEQHQAVSVRSATAPTRSVRRATARRVSNRRATARSRQGDPKARIIEFLAQHPESTAGDVR
jgi:hypothetical protein